MDTISAIQKRTERPLNLGFGALDTTRDHLIREKPDRKNGCY